MRDDFAEAENQEKAQELVESGTSSAESAELPQKRPLRTPPALPGVKKIITRKLPSFLTAAGRVVMTFLRALWRFFKKDSIPNMALVMTLITTVTAAGLGTVYTAAEARIAENKGALHKALGEVFPGLELTFAPSSVAGVHEGRDRDGKLAGFSVEVSVDGFAGAIRLIVGIDVRMQVTGIAVVSQRETTGFANNSRRADYLQQFIGQRGPFAVGEEIDAIAGATVSSAAVARGVNDALALLEGTQP